MRYVESRASRATSRTTLRSSARKGVRGAGGVAIAAFALCAIAVAVASLLPAPARAEDDPLVPPPTTLTVEFVGDGAIRVAGLAPGSTAVLLGAIHETQDFHARLSQVAEASTDTDGDGEVRFEVVGGKPPPMSVWLAADINSGTSGMTTGDLEFLPGLLPAPNLVSSERGGSPDRLHFAGRDAIEAVLVRIGGGSWSITGLDAGSGEASAIPDGDLELDIDEFSFLVGGSAPGALAASDLVLAIDPRSLEWTIATLGAGVAGGAP